MNWSEEQIHEYFAKAGQLEDALPTKADFMSALDEGALLPQFELPSPPEPTVDEPAYDYVGARPQKTGAAPSKPHRKPMRPSDFQDTPLGAAPADGEQGPTQLPGVTPSRKEATEAESKERSRREPLPKVPKGMADGVMSVDDAYGEQLM